MKQRAGKARADIERKPVQKRATPAANRVRDFVPLNVKSHFSFLDSALSIPAIIETARAMGAKALAITDPNLHGAVEFFTAARDAGIKPIIGAEVVSDGRRLNFYVENATGYANLCRLLSAPVVSAALLAAHREGLIAVDAARVALPEIRYRSPADRQKFAIIQSIRTLTRLHEAHAEKRRGDLHWPTATEVAARWSDEAIRATHEIAERCEFAFEFGRLRFPRFTPEDGSTPHDFLARLAFDGLRRRYGDARALHEAQLREELGIIAEVGYEEYFLDVWEILQECQRRGIAWITRGSAADSLVCYCLGISGVCPIRFELYFRRFLNRERMALNKLPDIDIDFAHDRKDDVVDLIFRAIRPAARGHRRRVQHVSGALGRGRHREGARRFRVSNPAAHRARPAHDRRARRRGRGHGAGVPREPVERGALQDRARNGRVPRRLPAPRQRCTRAASCLSRDPIVR